MKIFSILSIYALFDKYKVDYLIQFSVIYFDNCKQNHITITYLYYF